VLDSWGGGYEAVEVAGDSFEPVEEGAQEREAVAGGEDGEKEGDMCWGEGGGGVVVVVVVVVAGTDGIGFCTYNHDGDYYFPFSFSSSSSSSSSYLLNKPFRHSPRPPHQFLLFARTTTTLHVRRKDYYYWCFYYSLAVGPYHCIGWPTPN